MRAMPDSRIDREAPPHDLPALQRHGIGILAGGGRLPLMIAESVAARGGRVHIVGIEGEADAEIARFPHTWVNWGQIGRMVATLHADDSAAARHRRRPCAAPICGTSAPTSASSPACRASSGCWRAATIPC